MIKFPALTNATLTLVRQAGFTDDYDQSETVGATKWTGSEKVYFSEKIDHVMRGEREDRRGERDDVVLRRYVVIDDALPVTFAPGDVVTVTYNGAPQTGNVRKVMVTKATGLAGVTRLILEDA